MKCFILATCRKPELAPFTELVFKTLRVGFPTASVMVCVNGENTPVNCPALVKLCDEVKAVCHPIDATIHHEWIAGLLTTEEAPFWIVDTDLVFYDNVEDWKFDAPLAGWRIPEWQDEFSGAITRSRLHPSLLYIDPLQVKEKLAAFRSSGLDSEFTPFCNPVYPLMLPLNGRMYFHDTLSLLYHAVGGLAFTDAQKDKFFHFHFGSISDLVLPRLKNADQMAVSRKTVLDNPELGQGAWRWQENYFKDHQPDFSRPLPLPDITQADAKSAVEWNRRICQDNPEAMLFNDLWYRYVHGIDDLLDTRDDERPRMNSDQILGLFLNAAALYNSPFFVKHRAVLYPLVLSITNTFANSVAWERSPLDRRRIMADVWRTCGDEMYDMVSLIVGGWQHVRAVSPLVRDRDWLGQHDKDGNPT